MSATVQVSIACDEPNCNSYERHVCLVNADGSIELPASWATYDDKAYCSAHWPLHATKKVPTDVDTAKEKEIQDDADVENAR